jgi:hypothetical protein
MSVEYYAKLERGALGGVSASVLDAIARALQLDEAERAHLFHLAQAADGTSAAMRPAAAATSGPCGRACNGPSTPSRLRRRSSATTGLTCWPPTTWAGRYTPTSTTTPTAQNFARFTFLDSAAHRFYPDWDLAADLTVANLRTAAGQDPHNKSLHDLVGELSTRSEEFRRRWGSHNVRTHGTGTKHYHHHIVGDLTLAYESFDLRAEPGLSMTIYAAEPDSPTAHALALLASWAATHQPTQVQPRS